MPFYQHNDVEVLVSGHHKSEEAVYKGKICLEERQGIVFMEWFPEEEIECLAKTPDSEICDWEELSSSPSVGYSNSAEAVEIKASTKRKLLTSVEVLDICSYRLLEQSKYNQLTFHLKDGTTIPAFHFPNKDNQCLLNALRKHISFKRSSRDDSLFVVQDPKDALQKSFNELQLYDEKGDIVSKFFNDPYTTTLQGFSKVTNVFRDYLFYGKVPVMYSDSEMAEFLNESLPHSHSLPAPEYSLPPPVPDLACLINVNQEDAGFEVITCLDFPPRPKIERGDPLTMEEWNSHLKSDGSLKRVHKLKEKIFRGGIDPSLRPEVWKFLLGFYDFKASLSSREQHRKKRLDDYYRMKLQWKTFEKEQEDNFSALRDRKNLVEKDVGRTDRNHPFFTGEGNQHLVMLNDILMTYCMYNFDLGYVQGMSDLLSPLLVVNQNESDVFWCFVGFIDRVGTNFELSQQGMKTQLEQLKLLIHHWDPPFSDYLENHESGNLYFFFRWLLIIFKREFKFEDVMRLWEVLWTNLPCKNYHLLICLAILDPEKDTIVENKFGLTEILKHVNDMSFKIDLEATLCRAEGLYFQFENCTNLPQTVQDILGLKSKVTKVDSFVSHKKRSSIPGIEASTTFSNPSNAQPSTSSVGAKQPLPLPRSRSPSANSKATNVPKKSQLVTECPKTVLSTDSLDTSMIEDISDDIEAKYQMSFSLFS